MPDITLSDDARIDDPKLRALADRAAGVMKAAATKAAANLADPRTFPLSAQSTSLERLMRAHLASVPAAGRDIAKKSVLTKVADPAWARKELGEVAALKFESAIAIEDQDTVRKLPPIRFAHATPTAPAGPKAPVGPEAPAGDRELALRIHRVTCKADTSELFKDEIYLGGTSVDEAGDTMAVRAFKVGSFNRGAEQIYHPPRRVASFPAGASTSYTVALILVEKDMGDLAGFLDKVADYVHSYLSKELTKAGGPTVGTVLTYVLGNVFDYLQRLWADEIFDAKPLRIGGRFDSRERTLVYAGHGGRYEVVYDWALSA